MHVIAVNLQVIDLLIEMCCILQIPPISSIIILFYVFGDFMNDLTKIIYKNFNKESNCPSVFLNDFGFDSVFDNHFSTNSPFVIM